MSEERRFRDLSEVYFHLQLLICKCLFRDDIQTSLLPDLAPCKSSCGPESAISLGSLARGILSLTRHRFGSRLVTKVTVDDQILARERRYSK